VSSDLVGHIHRYCLVTFVSTTQKCYPRVTRIYFIQAIDFMNMFTSFSDERLPNDTTSTQRFRYVSTSTEIIQRIVSILFNYLEA
jgi:hypothetical protein